MNEFSTCIEFLLLNHDCVIVPDFGAFLAQQKDSRKSEADEAFLPPYRTVRFNPQLQEGDNSFTQSLCSIYRVSAPRAQKMLLEWISDFHQTLEEQGEVEFGSIGVFTKGHHQIQFEPYEAGVTTPLYYGLDAYHVEELVREVKPEEKTVRITAVKADDKQVTISINRTLLNYLSAAVVAIVLFMTFSTPVENSNVSVAKQNTAEIFLPSNLIYGNSISAKKIDTPSNKLVKEAKPDIKEQLPAEEPQVEAEKTPKYCIVLASMISKTNGTRYVEDLQSRGFKNAEFYERGKMRRVILSGFKSEEEASAKAHELHQKSEFESAWVATLE